MTFKRKNNRKLNEPRKITAKVGVIKNADGSAYFRMGDTEAYVAVYGPRDLYPKFLKDPSKGVLRCHYNMLPFSGQGNRVRPGSNRRAKEISLVTEEAFAPVVMLDDFPNTAVDVYIEMTQTDAGSRCVGICAASLALADAGIPMKDMVTAVAMGAIGKDILIDLEYDEEAYEGADVADIPVAVIPRTKEITLLQMDGKITKDMLKKGFKELMPVIDKIHEVQKKALKEKFEKGDNDAK